MSEGNQFHIQNCLAIINQSCDNKSLVLTSWLVPPLPVTDLSNQLWHLVSLPQVFTKHFLHVSTLTGTADMQWTRLTWSLPYWSFFLFGLHCMACGILVPQPGIEPVSPAVEAQSPNHWKSPGAYILMGEEGNIQERVFQIMQGERKTSKERRWMWEKIEEGRRLSWGVQALLVEVTSQEKLDQFLQPEWFLLTPPQQGSLGSHYQSTANWLFCGWTLYKACCGM